jgi:hypothetical protein
MHRTVDTTATAQLDVRSGHDSRDVLTGVGGVGAHATATPPASPQARTLALWHGDIAVVYTVAFGLSAGSVFFGPARSC